MSDPIDRLRTLEDPAVGPPLPAAEVRRLGDRRRRRRNALAAVGAAAAVAVLASGTVLAVQQDDRTAPAPPVDSPSPTAESSPTRGARADRVTEIPEGFVLDTGLPAAGGDVPGWEESQRLATPWRGLPCPTSQRSSGTWLEVDPQRTDAWSIEVQPPAEFHGRLLVVYPDAATARRALDEIRATAEGCGPFEALPGVTELRYAVRDVEYGDHPGLLVGGAEYLVETGELTGVSRSLNLLLRVGNAVLLTTLSDESSADPLDLEEPQAAALAAATAEVGDRMCVFAADPCG